MWNMFKVNDYYTRSRSGVFIVNFEHISYFFVSVVDFEQVDVSWAASLAQSKHSVICSVAP